MKELLKTLLMILLITLFAATVFAESTIVKFSDPSKPGLLKTIGNGNITITGYSGSDVVIDIGAGIEMEQNPPENEKSKGLKRISGSTVNVTFDKDNNVIEITRSMKHDADLTIKVPFNTSFKTGESRNTGSYVNLPDMVINKVFSGLGGGMLNGNINISNISGDIETSTLNGNITLSDISGTVLVNTIDGDINIIFKEYKKDKPMSFSSISGELDITLPSTLKADLKVKTVDGEVFTDFDIEMIPVSTEERSTGVLPSVGFNLGAMPGNSIYGKINGGGPEIRLNTINGNIYIRKKQ